MQRETCIRHFLQVGNYHPLQAARRLALRWKSRKALFGADRWLRPMTCTGAGALRPEYVEFLRTGYDAFLFPPDSSSAEENETTEQSQQRPIVTTTTDQKDQAKKKYCATLLIDRSRLPPQASHAPSEFMCQVGFYYTTIIADALANYSESCELSVLHIVHSKTSNFKANPTDNLPVTQLYLAGLPLRVKTVMVVKSFEPGTEHLVDYLSFRQQLFAKLSFQNVVSGGDILSGDSYKSTLQVLQEQNFHRACLPKCLGGDFSFDCHVSNWIRQRITLEDAMSAAPPVRNCEIASHAHGKSSSSSISSNSPITTRTTTAASASRVMGRNTKRRRASTPKSSPMAVVPSATNAATGRCNGNDEDESNKAIQSLQYSSSSQQQPALLIERMEGESEKEFRRRRSCFFAKRCNERLRRMEKGRTCSN